MGVTKLQISIIVIMHERATPPTASVPTHVWLETPHKYLRTSQKVFADLDLPRRPVRLATSAAQASS
jgi:hypothetical protein